MNIKLLYKFGWAVLLLPTLITNICEVWFTWMADRMEDVNNWWVQVCYKLDGRDAHGRTPEHRAEIDARRYTWMVERGCTIRHHPCNSPVQFSPATGLYHCRVCEVSHRDDPQQNPREFTWYNIDGKRIGSLGTVDDMEIMIMPRTEPFPEFDAQGNFH